VADPLYNRAMNDTDLILSALQMGAPPKRKQGRMKPIFESGFTVGPDPIFRVSRTKCSTPKRGKSIAAWASVDFVRYFRQCLSHFGIEPDLVETRDSDGAKKIYDMFVDELGGSMTNYVLRDYIDWWVGIYAIARASRPIGVFSLIREKDILRFLKQYDRNLATTPRSLDQPVQTAEITPGELYSMSGISLVVMGYGIVEAYKVLVAGGEKNVYAQLSDVLKGYSKQVLTKVIDITVAKRYNKKDVVDFMSVARPALKFHGVEKQFDHLDYTRYFMEG